MKQLKYILKLKRLLYKAKRSVLFEIVEIFFNTKSSIIIFTILSNTINNKLLIGDEFMKKLFIIPVIFLIVLFNTSVVHSSPSLNDKDLLSIYNEVFDTIMPNQEDISDKTYIAIDMTTPPVKSLSASSKLQILNNMKKYEINRLNVISSSMQDLNAKGLVNKNNALDFNGIRGIYLSISSIDVAENGNVTVLGGWYCSRHSGQDMRMTLKKENGKWKIRERKVMNVQQ